MRAFFILLLLLNIGVFALLTLPARHDPPPQPGPTPDGSLTLVDEEEALARAEREAADDEPATGDTPAESPAATADPPRQNAPPGAETRDAEPDDAPAPEPADATAAEPPADDSQGQADAGATGEPARSCFRSAPLAEEQATARAAALRRRDTPATVVPEETRERIGFWAYIPPHASMDAAQETMAALADAGIEDYGYVAGNEREHAVSLGIYSSRARAARRADDIRALGFATEIGERFRTTTEHRVLARAEAAPESTDGNWEPADCEPLAG